jgi:uncharacterized glyoxalase superfamily protein PhnB
MLKKNRAAPDSAVIPVLHYPDVRQAVEWLTTAMPFTERLRIGDHRCQLLHGNGAVVVAERGGHSNDASSTLQGAGAHSVMLRVTGIDDLFERARAAGARVLAEPADHMFGERQCSFLDPWGHPWTLSETIFDSDPAEWGGELVLEVGAASRTANLTGIAPQFLVDDIGRSIEYYRRRLGFELDFQYETFYASVSRDGCSIHLKCAPKTEADRAHRRLHDHLDAYVAVRDAASLHGELRSRGARVTKPLEDRPWSCRDFYVEDPDGYILCFSEQTA